MKKILFSVAVVLCLGIATSCSCNRSQNVENEVVEAVDTVAVADSTVVAADTLVVAE